MFRAEAFGGEPTYRVSQLTDEIREVLGEVFPGLWVRGEIQRLRPSRAGHLYFELVEKGRGDQIVGKLDAVVWRTDHQRVRRQLSSAGQRLDEGQEIRCWGGVDFWGPGGRLQLVVREIDPVFTLGHLERRRRETLEALRAAGLLERNASLELSPVPLSIGLVTSEDSAAYHDFLAGLAESGYGFRVRFVHAAVQGRTAERELASALELLGAASDHLDAVVVVRGGGARTDLAAFDSRAVAEAIARCPLPVICGLGHEIDRSLADVTCHTAVKTPTRAAEVLIERVLLADANVRELERDLAEAARRRLDDARRRIGRLESLARRAALVLADRGHQVEDAARRMELLARGHLRRAGVQLALLGERLRHAGDATLERHRDAVDTTGRRIVERASQRLAHELLRLDGHALLCHALAPERLLERGYSLTYDAEGRPVRDPDGLRSGDLLETRLARGRIHSRVVQAPEE